MYLLDSGEAPAEELSAETLRIFELGTERGATLADALTAGIGPEWEAGEALASHRCPGEQSELLVGSR
jgi:hypothetical protein